MKNAKCYTRIWKVDKVLYAVSDVKLPVPLTFSQLSWLGISIFAMLILGNVPIINSIPFLLRYFGIPIGITYLMNKKTFDGKKPVSFLRSVIGYMVRGKVTYAGQKVELKKVTVENTVTGVRSEVYVPD